MTPCQSTRERGSSAPAGLNSCPRSLSTPANKKQFSLQVLLMLSSDENKQAEPAAPESKSGKHKP
ncbi:hypothetical protein SLEP1_g28518 [Rubroshorea leprosula]|uniref:Uncharacterized protein n=1 Tax=Rubroshorea leprosula TaxID=152421 RepID=A0AAV5K124_9ROSI|nr:hypothetical protein SLEP1_g28518 [Rubroshorea leprosula]